MRNTPLFKIAYQFLTEVMKVMLDVIYDTLETVSIPYRGNENSPSAPILVQPL